MKTKTLKIQKRNVFGRKVKKLRSEGILPANIYGKKVKSQSVQVNEKEFINIFKETGETGLLNLDIDDKKIPVLIHNISYHPVTDKILHAEFLQVDLKEKVVTNVPIEYTGEPAAVKENKGTLLTLMSEIEVEALPSDLPENITIDISSLSDVDQAIKLSDIKIDNKISVKTDLNTELARIAPIKIEEEVKTVEEPTEGVEEEAEEKEKEKKDTDEKDEKSQNQEGNAKEEKKTEKQT